MTTAFQCTRCGDCCRNLSNGRVVILFPGELEVIAEGLAVERFKMEELTEPVPQLTEIGVMVRKLRHHEGVCVFLDQDNLCNIHSFKPYQCRMGPDQFLFDRVSDYACMEGVDPPHDSTPDDEINLFRLFL